ncbi:MAG: DUF488 domain-containing protein [Methanocella sp.]|jgi:uncharacterized protein YeaO (DUF488 family)
MPIALKRAYEKPSESDGKRILVERLWPRGLRKEEAAIDLWLKEVAPSRDLRKWYNHDPAKWVEFKARYWAELDRQKETAARLAKEAKNAQITFVFGSKEEKLNSAAALKEYIQQHFS